MMRKKSIGTILLLGSLLSTSVFAESSREIRGQHKLGANVFWHPMSVPIASAKGVTVSYYLGRKGSLDFEYSSATYTFSYFGVDWGEVAETKVGLQLRRFIGNSFNMKIGAGHRTTEARVPSDWLNLAIGEHDKTVSQWDATYITVGMGNQWQFNRRYTFVLDWFVLDIPVSADVTQSVSQYANSQNDKDNIERAESILRYYPSGGILRFQVGMLF